MTALSPIETARTLFHKGNQDFDVALQEHLLNAYVVARPTMFAMARAIDLDGVHTWFITSAAGNILELLTALPFSLPQIAFYRNNEKRLRIYSLQKLAHKALRLNK